MDSVAHVRYVVSSADLFIYLSYTELISGREHGGRLWVRRCVCLYPLPSGIGSRKSGPSRVVTDDDHRKIERWQAGESVPTINQLSQFSKKLRILVGYFSLTIRLMMSLRYSLTVLSPMRPLLSLLGNSPIL